MSGDFERDAHQDPNSNPLLPKLTPPLIYNNISFNGVVYVKIVGLPNGPKLSYTESMEIVQFRFRAKELKGVIGKEDERIIRIHRGSGATIRILYDTQSKLHGHLCLQFLGNANQVKVAETLITNAIKEAYTATPFIPRPLMPTDIHFYLVTMSVTQVERLLINLLKMESDSNTWIEVGKRSHEGKSLERPVVTFYGKPSDIHNAILMINDCFAQYKELLKVENEETGCSEKPGKMEDEILKDVGEDDSGIKEGRMNDLLVQYEEVPKVGNEETGSVEKSGKMEDEIQKDVEEDDSGLQRG